MTPSPSTRYVTGMRSPVAVLMASEGTYPSDRFTHNTQFRIDTAEAQESR